MLIAACRLALPLVSLLLVACDDDSSLPSVVGDWFICRDDDCSRFESSGVRFEHGGTMLALRTDDDLISAAAPFCISIGKESGNYAFDGKLLVIKVDGKLQEFETDLVGDSMVLVPLTNEGRRIEIRRFKTKVSSDCEDFGDPSSDDPPQVTQVNMPASNPIMPSPPDGNGPRIDGHVGPRRDAGSSDAGAVTLSDAGSQLDGGSAPDGGAEAVEDSGLSDSGSAEPGEQDAALSDAAAL